MEIGEELPEKVQYITQDSIYRYAYATGDFNPIHVDEEFAKGTAFKGTIAHGFYLLAFISELMTRKFGKRWTNSGRLDVKFKRPVRPGDKITLKATLKGRHQTDGCFRLVFDAVWENQMHEPVLLGEVSILE